METIEERANEFALKKHPYSPFCEEYAKMYIEIATEQKAIDDKLLKRVHKGVLDKAIKEKKELIEKAIMAHCECCTAYDACKSRGKFGCYWTRKIRKAMEE